jgi:hypothetical protein
MNTIDLQIPRQAATLRHLVEDGIRTAMIAKHFKLS